MRGFRFGDFLETLAVGAVAVLLALLCLSLVVGLAILAWYAWHGWTLVIVPGILLVTFMIGYFVESEFV